MTFFVKEYIIYWGDISNLFFIDYSPTANFLIEGITIDNSYVFIVKDMFKTGIFNMPVLFKTRKNYHLWIWKNLYWRYGRGFLNTYKIESYLCIKKARYFNKSFYNYSYGLLGYQYFFNTKIMQFMIHPNAIGDTYHMTFFECLEHKTIIGKWGYLAKRMRPKPFWFYYFSRMGDIKFHYFSYKTDEFLVIWKTWTKLYNFYLAHLGKRCHVGFLQNYIFYNLTDLNLFSNELNTLFLPEKYISMTKVNVLNKNIYEIFHILTLFNMVFIIGFILFKWMMLISVWYDISFMLFFFNRTILSSVIRLYYFLLGFYELFKINLISLRLWKPVITLEVESGLEEYFMQKYLEQDTYIFKFNFQKKHKNYYIEDEEKSAMIKKFNDNQRHGFFFLYLYNHRYKYFLKLENILIRLNYLFDYSYFAELINKKSLKTLFYCFNLYLLTIILICMHLLKIVIVQFLNSIIAIMNYMKYFLKSDTYNWYNYIRYEYYLNWSEEPKFQKRFVEQKYDFWIYWINMVSDLMYFFMYIRKERLIFKEKYEKELKKKPHELTKERTKKIIRQEYESEKIWYSLINTHMDTSDYSVIFLKFWKKINGLFIKNEFNFHDMFYDEPYFFSIYEQKKNFTSNQLKKYLFRELFLFKYEKFFNKYNYIYDYISQIRIKVFLYFYFYFWIFYHIFLFLKLINLLKSIYLNFVHKNILFFNLCACYVMFLNNIRVFKKTSYLLWFLSIIWKWIKIVKNFVVSIKIYIGMKWNYFIKGSFFLFQVRLYKSNLYHWIKYLLWFFFFRIWFIIALLVVVIYFINHLEIKYQFFTTGFLGELGYSLEHVYQFFLFDQRFSIIDTLFALVRQDYFDYFNSSICYKINFEDLDLLDYFWLKFLYEWYDKFVGMTYFDSGIYGVIKWISLKLNIDYKWHLFNWTLFRGLDFGFIYYNIILWKLDWPTTYFLWKLYFIDILMLYVYFIFDWFYHYYFYIKIYNIDTKWTFLNFNTYIIYYINIIYNWYTAIQYKIYIYSITDQVEQGIEMQKNAIIEFGNWLNGIKNIGDIISKYYWWKVVRSYAMADFFLYFEYCWYYFYHYVYYHSYNYIYSFYNILIYIFDLFLPSQFQFNYMTYNIIGGYEIVNNYFTYPILILLNKFLAFFFESPHELTVRSYEYPVVDVNYHFPYESIEKPREMHVGFSSVNKLFFLSWNVNIELVEEVLLYGWKYNFNFSSSLIIISWIYVSIIIHILGRIFVFSIKGFRTVNAKNILTQSYMKLWSDFNTKKNLNLLTYREYNWIMDFEWANAFKSYWKRVFPENDRVCMSSYDTIVPNGEYAYMYVFLMNFFAKEPIDLNTFFDTYIVEDEDEKKNKDKEDKKNNKEKKKKKIYKYKYQNEYDNFNLKHGWKIIAYQDIYYKKRYKKLASAIELAFRIYHSDKSIDNSIAKWNFEFGSSYSQLLYKSEEYDEYFSNRGGRYFQFRQFWNREDLWRYKFAMPLLYNTCDNPEFIEYYMTLDETRKRNIFKMETFLNEKEKYNIDMHELYFSEPSLYETFTETIPGISIDRNTLYGSILLHQTYNRFEFRPWYHKLFSLNKPWMIESLFKLEDYVYKLGNWDERYFNNFFNITLYDAFEWPKHMITKINLDQLYDLHNVVRDQDIKEFGDTEFLRKDAMIYRADGESDDHFQGRINALWREVLSPIDDVYNEMCVAPYKQGPVMPLALPYLLLLVVGDNFFYSFITHGNLTEFIFVMYEYLIIILQYFDLEFSTIIMQNEWFNVNPGLAAMVVRDFMGMGFTISFIGSGCQPWMLYNIDIPDSYHFTQFIYSSDNIILYPFQEFFSLLEKKIYFYYDNLVQEHYTNRGHLKLKVNIAKDILPIGYDVWEINHHYSHVGHIQGILTFLTRVLAWALLFLGNYILQVPLFLIEIGISVLVISQLNIFIIWFRNIFLK